jgi:hypothetical protein
MKQRRYKIEFTLTQLQDIVQALVTSAHPTECIKAAQEIIETVPAKYHAVRKFLWECVGSAVYAAVSAWNNCHEEDEPFYNVDQHESADPRQWEIYETDEAQAKR